MLKGLFLRAVRIYNEDGAIELISKSKKFAFRFIKNGFKVHRYQTDERVDTQKRLEIIQKQIDENDSSLLDIGCADGYLTSKFHEKGLFCIGVDQAEQMLAIARSGRQYKDGLGFIRKEITPDSLSKLPDFDVILLLTVYHHWVNSYGLKTAEDMLVELTEKGNKLFFQPPGKEIHNNVQKSSDQSIEEYYMNYLKETLPESTDIKLLDTTDYTDGERRDPLYLIMRN
ncbi:methyltransferase [Natronosalvus vescus]|uniref:methyltransferase n=1 Tax=Natronosalvus vescus TaxID=2953881 RepID=UPI0020906AA9|nr:methyltransferase [Natronosalvus vescus]